MLIASLPPSPTQPAPLPRLRRAGFTLMELLVVIGIVALLATIVTVGIATALGKTVDRATTTRLEMLDTMLAAYATADNDSTGGQGNTAAKRLPPQLAAIPGGVTYSTRDSQPQGAAGDPLLAPSAMGGGAATCQAQTSATVIGCARPVR